MHPVVVESYCCCAYLPIANLLDVPESPSIICKQMTHTRQQHVHLISIYGTCQVDYDTSRGLAGSAGQQQFITWMAEYVKQNLRPYIEITLKLDMAQVSCGVGHLQLSKPRMSKQTMSNFAGQTSQPP